MRSWLMAHSLSIHSFFCSCHDNQLLIKFSSLALYIGNTYVWYRQRSNDPPDPTSILYISAPSAALRQSCVTNIDIISLWLLFSWYGLAWSLNMPFYVIHAKMTFVLFYGLLSMHFSHREEVGNIILYYVYVWELGSTQLQVFIHKPCKLYTFLHMLCIYGFVSWYGRHREDFK